MQADRDRLLRELNVSVVLDVGANSGQYARRIRESGYEGRIISFEPLTAAYAELAAAAAGDASWETYNLALGESASQQYINVSENSYSSSLLPITDACVAAAPEAAYVERQLVQIAPLDAIELPPEETMLKMDTQGYELPVLRGAERLLGRVRLVETELSIVPLYDGQELAGELCDFMRSRGFVPVALDVAFSHPTTNEILQLDAMFQRVA